MYPNWFNKSLHPPGFLTGPSEPFFFICIFSKLQLTDKTIRNVSFLILGFKPQVSGTEIECSGSCATAHYLKVIFITPTWTSNATYSWCTLIGLIKACTHRGLFNWPLPSFFSSFAPFPNCNWQTKPFGLFHCRCWDSNCRCLVLKATALPNALQPFTLRLFS